MATPESDDFGLRAAFPQLARFDVTSPRDLTYNCAAWAAGRNDIWMWPDRACTAHWPEGVPREETISAFVTAYATLGFAPCDSRDFEEGLLKIAVFERGGMPTHVARQLGDGSWTSKCGQSVDIVHELTELEGAIYGTVAILMSTPYEHALLTSRNPRSLRSRKRSQQLTTHQGQPTNPMLAGSITTPNRVDLIEVPEPTLSNNGTPEIIFQPEITCLCRMRISAETGRKSCMMERAAS